MQQKVRAAPRGSYKKVLRATQYKVSGCHGYYDPKQPQLGVKETVKMKQARYLKSGTRAASRLREAMKI